MPSVKKRSTSPHKCFIQTIPEKEDHPKLKRVNKVSGRHFIEHEPTDPDRRVFVHCHPPLQVYADYEATIDANGVQSPLLLCAETNEDDETDLGDHITPILNRLHWLPEAFRVELLQPTYVS